MIRVLPSKNCVTVKADFLRNGLLASLFLSVATAGLLPIAFAEGAEMEKSSLVFDMATFSPDQSLWSDKTKLKFENSKNTDRDPLAVVRIDRLNIEGPVFVGTDKKTLDFGIGIVKGTAMPGEVGNMALSAHRDSFFRPLKDIIVGDRIEMSTDAGQQDFEVTNISIVDSQDISVLDHTDTTVLTLITCHPFYYEGYAPDRFIVRAIPVD